MAKRLMRGLQKKKLLINYSLFGTAAFIISFIVFAFLEQLTDMNWAQANIIAWIIATIFCYFTNRAYVFNSHHEYFWTEALEMVRFFIGRGATLVSEQIILWVGIRLLGIASLSVKLFAQLVVIVLNYVISKFLVFRKTKKANLSRNKKTIL